MFSSLTSKGLCFPGGAGIAQHFVFLLRDFGLSVGWCRLPCGKCPALYKKVDALVTTQSPHVQGTDPMVVEAGDRLCASLFLLPLSCNQKPPAPLCSLHCYSCLYQALLQWVGEVWVRERALASIAPLLSLCLTAVSADHSGWNVASAPLQSMKWGLQWWAGHRSGSEGQIPASVALWWWLVRLPASVHSHISAS